MRVVNSNAAAIVAGASVVLLGAVTHADTPAPTSVVIWVEGPHADEARAEITKSLGSDATVVDPKPWHDAYIGYGSSGSLASDLAKPKTRTDVIEHSRHAASSVNVTEVIIVSTSRSRGHHVADAYLVPKDGEIDVLSHLAFGERGAPLGTAVHDKMLASRPAVIVAIATPPVASIAAPEASPPPPRPSEVADAPPSPRPTHRRPHHVFGRELFDLSAGVEWGSRQFSFVDPSNTSLQTYWLGAAALLLASGTVYPLADLMVPVLSDLGIFGGYAQALGLNSESNAGSIGTEWYRWYVGGRLRIRTGSPNAPVIGLTGAYGSESFSFSTDPSPMQTYPSFTYDFIRATGDVRVPMRPFAVTVSGGYLGVLSASGNVPMLYPGASVAGVELGLGAALEIQSGFEVRLAGSYRRFFYATTPTVPSAPLDELWGLSLMLAYVY
jgi:hypothetical protein